MFICAPCVGSDLKGQKRASFPGTGVTGCYELPCARNKIQVCREQRGLLTVEPLSPVLGFGFCLEGQWLLLTIGQFLYG